MRAGCAEPALRGQRFTNEQILWGSAPGALRLALSEPVKGHHRPVCRVNVTAFEV